jgi:hypothetical protein
MPGVNTMISIPGVAGGVVNAHPLVFSRILDTIPVNGWEVVQKSYGLHVLLSSVRGEFGDEIRFHLATSKGTYYVMLPGKKGTYEHILYGKAGTAL